MEREQPDHIFHLGDCWQDARRLTERYPQIPMEQVPGNCDFQPASPAEKLVGVEECRILLCHGHTYGVKQSLLRAALAAEEQKVQAFLFGHTHLPLVDRRGDTLFLNPGSVGTGRCPTYGVLTVQGRVLDGRTAFVREDWKQYK